MAKPGYLPYGHVELVPADQVALMSPETAQALLDAQQYPVDPDEYPWFWLDVFDASPPGVHDIFSLNGPWRGLIERVSRSAPMSDVPGEDLLWEGEGNEALDRFVSELFDGPSDEERALLLLGGPLTANAVFEHGGASLQLIVAGPTSVSEDLDADPDWNGEDPSAFQWEGARDRDSIRQALEVLPLGACLQIRLDWRGPVSQPPAARELPAPRRIGTVDELVAHLSEAYEVSSPHTHIRGRAASIEFYEDMTTGGTLGIEWNAGGAPPDARKLPVRPPEPFSNGWEDETWSTGFVPREDAFVILAELLLQAGGPYELRSLP